MILDPKAQLEIANSVSQYHDIILKDINSIVRLVDSEGKVYTSALSKWEKNDIIFAAPIERCDFVIFPLPIDLEICFITKQTVFVANIHVTTRQPVNGKLLYKGYLTSPLVKKQQRAHYRLTTLFHVKYRLIPREDQRVDNEQLLNLNEGTTVNISAGGMCLLTKYQLQPKDCVEITFQFLDHEFNIQGEVLEQGERNTTGNYTHRIRFINLDARKENLLSKLIFEKQRLLVKSNNQPLFKK
ncbi:PilZ domain-containing protein [Niameybacter massiliensis]|uniref:PilZ domain-containing protein n=1 Tax=Holtiella tumoricola TaxID=3018743 RepID=A0AA42DM95_9FIRM|nr:PilZ domain-containing protein [Holtiella tumoricola]